MHVLKCGTFALQEREIIYHNYFYTCKSTALHITLGILYGYKGLLQVVSLLFAFQIRKVKVKGLNDAKYITAAVYETSVVLAVIVVSTYTLVEFVNIYPLVIGLGLLVGATGILIIAFVPIVSAASIISIVGRVWSIALSDIHVLCSRLSCN